MKNEIREYYNEALKKHKAAEEQKLKDFEAEFNRKNGLDTTEAKNRQLEPLTKKEQAKAELRRLESEYNKNYEKMSSEEVIEMEIKMDAIKKDLATGRNDEQGGMILRPQMLNVLNTQKEEIEKELKDKTLSDDARVGLETRLEIINNEMAEIQEEIKKDMEDMFFN